MQDEHIRTGKSMLEVHAKTKGYSWNVLMTNANFERVAEKLNFNTPDEMYAAVGCGAVTPQQVVYKFVDIYRKEKPIDEQLIKDNSSRIHKSHAAGDVIIKGVDGLLIRYAGCCNPVPGDNIVGFVSRGRGVTVHRADCPNLKNEDQERVLPARWSDRSTDNYVVSIKITGTEKAPLMYIVSSACSTLGLFCLTFNGRVDAKTHTSIADMTIRLNKKEDLEQLFNKLRDSSDILDVYRTIV